MPKRRIDPTTGEPQITDREQRLINEYINNGGNGTHAAASAGYGAARPDQSAYQVLHRPEVQRRIRQRIAESRVSADEIIGTLLSFTRGSLGDFFDQSGDFSIELAKQKGFDHLLKSITVTTREFEATRTKPAHVARTYRAQLHSPLQAANILARIFGIDRKSLARRPLHGDAFAEAMAADFRVSTWLEDTIQQQMKQQCQPRAAVIDTLLQVRPEIAKYLRELPDQQDPAGDLIARDNKAALGLILDFMVGLASGSEASPDTDPVVESSDQIQAVTAELNRGAITPDDARAAISRINGRLSELERDELHRLQVNTIIYNNMSQSHLTQAEALDQVRQQAADLVDIQGAPSPEIIEQCINDYFASQTSAAPEPEPPVSVPPAAPTRDSRLETRDSTANVPTCQRANVSTPPTPDSRLETRDSLPTQDPGPETQDSPDNLQPTKGPPPKRRWQDKYLTKAPQTGRPPLPYDPGQPPEKITPDSPARLGWPWHIGS